MKIPVNPDIHRVPDITLRTPNGTAVKLFTDSELNIFVGVRGLLGACGYSASTRPNYFCGIAAKDWYTVDSNKNIVLPFERVSSALESFSEKKQQINPPRRLVIKRVLEWWKNVAVPRIEDIRRSPEFERKIQPALTIIDEHDINSEPCGVLSYRGTNLYFYANSQHEFFVSPSTLMKACGYTSRIMLFNGHNLSPWGKLIVNHGVPVYSVRNSSFKVYVIPTEHVVELLEDFATSPEIYVENCKKRLVSDIHKFSCVPDMSDDSFAGNASGVAISYKLIGLQQICARKQREFKKALQRRIELIAGILKLKEQAQIDFRDIDINFTINLPQDLLSLSQVINSLDGLVSQKTLLSLLPFVTEPREELNELDNECAETNSDIYSRSDE